jgi:pimeloyl-ACP methyl ester carboxylesterase
LLGGLLDQLGLEQADVLGISWGGGLAQQFALRRPDRVRRLVLVATGPGALMVPGSWPPPGAPAPGRRLATPPPPTTPRCGTRWGDGSRRAWVLNTLAGLAIDDEHHARLRGTLLVFL